MTGASHKYCVNSIGGLLKVTLVWHDPPAAPNAASQLVNDLDLIVYADSLNGYSTPGNGFTDRVNNVEQVGRSTLHLVHQPHLLADPGCEVDPGCLGVTLHNP